MRVFFLLVGFFFFISSCKEWEFPQNFPLVFTEEIVNVNFEGADFIGRVESLGVNQNIIDYGFVWAESNMPTLSSSKVSFSQAIRKGIFSKTIKNDLIAGKTYYVRAFVQTNELVIYGNEVIFTSQGSRQAIIMDFLPKEGFDGTEISIKGQNFSSRLEGNLVKIGELKCQVISATDTLVKIISPITSLVGDYKISVEVADKLIISETEYSILGPRITSMSRLSGRVGDLLTIGGEYFDGDNFTTLFFGVGHQGISNEAFAYVLSPDQIECYVPDFPGYVGTVGLYSISDSRPDSKPKEFVFHENFTIKDSWKKISDQTPLGSVVGYSAVSINNIVYVVGGNTLYRFNPATGMWLEKAPFPGLRRDYGSAFVLGNKLYYGFGEKSFDGLRLNDLWVYDFGTNTWDFLMNAPIPARSRLIAFVIDEKAYIGFGFSKIDFNAVSYSDFWKFDPSDNSWTEMVTPLTNETEYRMSCFTVSNKGYLFGVTGGGTLWEFDPEASTWSRKSDLAIGPYNGNPGVSLNSSGMVFSGSQYGESNRVYEYNPLKDRWITRQTLHEAGGRMGEVAAFVNGKVYYGFGEFSNAYSDFWELTVQ
jgi:N-acetylneuraminic acid mutarotase